MISPRIDKLLEHVDSDYASVIVAAKRARQINSYYHNLGEGTFDEFPPPMVETRSKNYLTIALEEVAQGKLKLLIGRKFPLAEATEAHRFMESRQSTAKLVLNP